MLQVNGLINGVDEGVAFPPLLGNGVDKSLDGTVDDGLEDDKNEGVYRTTDFNYMNSFIYY